MKKVVVLAALLLLFTTTSTVLLGEARIEEAYQAKPYILHIVKQGESISLILKKYQVPFNDFMNSNPNVFAKGDVSLGEELNIPRKSIGNATDASINRDVKDFLIERGKLTQQHIADSIKQEATKPTEESILQKLDPATKKYDYHNVMPKETLYSISKLYNVSTEDILNYNDDVKEGGLKEYTVIRIPKFDFSANESATSLMKSATKTEITKFEVFENSSERSTANIAMIMPIVGESDPRDEGFKDIYRGFLLAASDMKQKGISTYIDFYGVGRTTDLVYKLIVSGELAKKDLIVGPVFENQFDMVASYAASHQIPIISPLISTQSDNGYVIEVAPDKSTRYDKIDDFFKGKHIIRYSSANDDEDFIESIQSLSEGIDATITYNKFATPESMAQILSESKENVFIVSAKDNLNIELLLSKLTALKATAYNRKISVFAASHVSNIPKEKRGDFFKVDLRYVTSFFQDRTNQESLEFETKYFDMFSMAPSPYSYRGYEMGTIFIESIAENGKKFMNALNDVALQPIQMPYLFYRDNRDKKMINQEWLLINYTPNYTIIIK